MHLSQITIENFRCFGVGDQRFELHLKKTGLTALVGENDSGKSAVIDALRFVLGTTDKEWYRVDDTDFYQEETSRDIKIVCKFDGLSNSDKRAFVEYLTYEGNLEYEPVLYINWTAHDISKERRGRSYLRVRVEMHSGKDGNGPNFAPEVRELLRATYLQPLRDAEQALSSGRTSRLSQVLLQKDQIKTGGIKYDPDASLDMETLNKLNVLGIGDLANALLKKQQGIVSTSNEIDAYLGRISLRGDGLESNINVSGETSSEDIRLRKLLEKFNLSLSGSGKHGLGSNNLLFMACEFLLLSQEDEGFKLLLIEEPEAHLHAHRQLRIMKFLQEQAEEKHIQIIVTTHSPNLASAINLENMVILDNYRGFSLAKDQTKLRPSDYRFLQRFLDVTKANLFFARGVMIVEGDSENI